MNTATNNDQYSSYHRLSCKLTSVVVTNLWMWYQVSLLLNTSRTPRLPFNATAVHSASVSVFPYSRVPCLIPKPTLCWSDSINSPCCYTFCQPFVTLHSNRSLETFVCKATLDMSLLQCVHLSSRIMQLRIWWWLFVLYTLDPEKHPDHSFCLKKQTIGAIPLSSTSDVFCHHRVTFFLNDHTFPFLTCVTVINY